MKRFKLAFLANISSVHAFRWANALADRGHEIHVFTQHRGSGNVSPMVKSIHYLPFRGNKGYFLNAPLLRMFLKRLQPDFLHAHYASGYGALGRFSGFHPYMISVWGSDVYDFPTESAKKMALLKNNLKAADLIGSTSHAMARHTATLCDQRSSKIRVTPFGIDMQVFKPKAFSQEKTITVGTVKKLAFKYGIDTLITAFNIARNSLMENNEYLASKLRLLIVGDGKDKKFLNDLVKSLDTDGITQWTGFVPHSLVPDYLNKLDIYVAASRLDSESFGVAILEASACGVPVVATNVGGLPEVVKDGVTGKLVNPDDSQALANVIKELIVDENLRKSMGQAGVQWVRDNYGWEESISIMEKVYEELWQSWQKNCI